MTNYLGERVDQPGGPREGRATRGGRTCRTHTAGRDRSGPRIREPGDHRSSRETSRRRRPRSHDDNRRRGKPASVRLSPLPRTWSCRQAPPRPRAGPGRGVALRSRPAEQSGTTAGRTGSYSGRKAGARDLDGSGGADDPVAVVGIGRPSPGLYPWTTAPEASDFLDARMTLGEASEGIHELIPSTLSASHSVAGLLRATGSQGPIAGDGIAARRSRRWSPPG